MKNASSQRPNRSSASSKNCDPQCDDLRMQASQRQQHILQIEWVDTDTIVPDPTNARHHSVQQLRKLARDMRKNGFTNPILVTHEGVVIAGHARLHASKLVGFTQVPIIRLRLSDAEAKARNIWDNRSSDLSRFDNVLLGRAMSELISLDVDLDETGFSVAECDLLIQESFGGEAASAEQVDIPPGPPVTKPDDVWLCDGHRVLCGDAEKSSSYLALMNGERAHAAFTDVPYNRKAHDISGKGKNGPRSFGMASGEMSQERYANFLAGCLSLMARHSADGSLHYPCIDWRHLSDLHDQAVEIYASLLNICVWVKPNAGMGSLYRSRHEFVGVYKNGKGKHRNNVQLGRFGRNRSNVWEYAGGTTISGRLTDEGNLLDLHPTVKPVQMVLDAILDCTARGETVLDPFLGSGTTLIAAERAGRRLFGMEIDPQYVDVAVRRWQQHTGRQAVHAASNETFDEVARSRHGRV